MAAANSSNSSNPRFPTTTTTTSVSTVTPVTMAEVVEFLAANVETFRTATITRLYADILETRHIFPPHLVEIQQTAAQAVLEVLRDASTHAGELSTGMLRKISEVAVAQRRYAYPATAYLNFAQALNHGLRETLSSQNAAYTQAAADIEEVFATLSANLAKAALVADHAGIPAAFTGEIISIERPCRRINVVTLDMGIPMEYNPGQTVLTTSAHMPGVWVPLAPAVPSTEFGQVEFHIYRDGKTHSEPLEHAREGDYWTFSNPNGNLEIPRDKPLVLLAHYGGYAQARAILFELLNWTNPPTVEFIWRAQYPGELYELKQLQKLASVNPWLNLRFIADNATDAWWVRPLETNSSTDFTVLPANTELASLVQWSAYPDSTVIAMGPGARETALPANAQIFSWD
ncbi:hypothetical protein [Corynebacterium caspium]|uniref:hypothetical protein n=2 Tax=Corynebacterium caspium TaxID=234828 RepID=UPI001B7F7E89|nr:hypothetical protein [Corynebacterium caspium]